MEKTGGVYMIPAKVNGLPLKFIFDTGASNVSISLTEATFMAKNGYINDDDITGTSFAQLADGSITENTRIKIRSIEIGGLQIHDVSATVIHNIDAPLLLGQSAIKKLGRIEFDGDNLIIHTSARLGGNKNIKIDEQSQAELDSLIILIGAEKASGDYIFAQKHIREARQLAIKSYITNRNWELDLLDALIRDAFATSIKDSWQRQMPALHAAFHANKEHKDGVIFSYKTLLEDYAYSLVQHFSPKDGSLLSDDDMSFEDEFIDVISLLMDYDKYSAYLNSAIYYSENFNMAKSYCEKAIAIDSTKSEGYVCLGTLYQWADNNEQAIKYYKKALSLPDATDKAYIYHLLALCYPSYSNKYKSYLNQAAKLGDMAAQNTFKERGIAW